MPGTIKEYCMSMQPTSVKRSQLSSGKSRLIEVAADGKIAGRPRAQAQSNCIQSGRRDSGILILVVSKMLELACGYLLMNRPRRG